MAHRHPDESLVGRRWEAGVAGRDDQAELAAVRRRSASIARPPPGGPPGRFEGETRRSGAEPGRTSGVDHQDEPGQARIGGQREQMGIPRRRPMWDCCPAGKPPGFSLEPRLEQVIFGRHSESVLFWPMVASLGGNVSKSQGNRRSGPGRLRCRGVGTIARPLPAGVVIIGPSSRLLARCRLSFPTATPSPGRAGRALCPGVGAVQGDAFVTWRSPSSASRSRSRPPRPC